MNEIVIEAKELKKTLGKGAGRVPALRGVDISLRRGDLTLLMGPSGSGKTTLLLLLVAC
jgi:putative ABC transport system ATP-binding protein